MPTRTSNIREKNLTFMNQTLHIVLSSLFYFTSPNGKRINSKDQSKFNKSKNELWRELFFAKPNFIESQ